MVIDTPRFSRRMPQLCHNRPQARQRSNRPTAAARVNPTQPDRAQPDHIGQSRPGPDPLGFSPVHNASVTTPSDVHARQSHPTRTVPGQNHQRRGGRCHCEIQVKRSGVACSIPRGILINQHGCQQRQAGSRPRESLLAQTAIATLPARRTDGFRLSDHIDPATKPRPWRPDKSRIDFQQRFHAARHPCGRAGVCPNDHTGHVDQHARGVNNRRHATPDADSRRSSGLAP